MGGDSVVSGVGCLYTRPPTPATSATVDLVPAAPRQRPRVAPRQQAGKGQKMGPSIPKRNNRPAANRRGPTSHTSRKFRKLRTAKGSNRTTNPPESIGDISGCKNNRPKRAGGNTKEKESGRKSIRPKHGPDKTAHTPSRTTSRREGATEKEKEVEYK